MSHVRGVVAVVAVVLAVLPSTGDAKPYQLTLEVEGATSRLHLDTTNRARDVELTTRDAVWRRSDTGVAIGVVVMVLGAVALVPGIVWLSDPCWGGDLCASGTVLGLFAVGIGGALILGGGVVALVSSAD